MWTIQFATIIWNSQYSDSICYAYCHCLKQNAYLGILILKALQKGLQQLCGIVNSFSIFTNDSNHWCPEWIHEPKYCYKQHTANIFNRLTKGIQDRSYSGNNATIPISYNVSISCYLLIKRRHFQANYITASPPEESTGSVEERQARNTWQWDVENNTKTIRYTLYLDAVGEAGSGQGKLERHCWWPMLQVEQWAVRRRFTC